MHRRLLKLRSSLPVFATAHELICGLKGSPTSRSNSTCKAANGRILKLKHLFVRNVEKQRSRNISLEIFLYKHMVVYMPRAATTSDVFNAIAEPRRRQIVDYLALGDQRDVNQIVIRLRLPQPAVSKHLRVLRQVGLVEVQKQGLRRLYRLKPEELKPVRDWIQNFERFWTDHLSDIKQAAELKAKKRAANDRGPSHQPVSKESKP